MATQVYRHPFSYGAQNLKPADFHTFAIRQQLPKWRECKDPRPPFVLEGADNWNCAKCSGDKAFFLPVFSTDELPFQFQYDDTVNADPAAPVYGWQESATPANEYYMAARILDCNCGAVDGMDSVDAFCTAWGVAHDESAGSFQYLKVDVGLLPVELCCFILQVEQYVKDPETGNVVLDQIITSGPYLRADSAECVPCEDETLLISGAWKVADIWGRRYDIEFGAGVFFENVVRLPGNIVYVGTSTDVTYDGEVEVKTTVRQKYRLILGGVPPMIAEWVSIILGSNKTLSIGGYLVDRSRGDTVGTVERSIDGVGMFYATIEFNLSHEMQNFQCY